MGGRLILLVITVFLLLPTKSIARKVCARFKVFNASSEIEGSIGLYWTVPNNTWCNKNVLGYNITYGTIGGLPKTTFLKWDKNQTVNVTLKNLIPGRMYMIVITVNFTNGETWSKRPMFKTSGNGTSPQATVSSTSSKGGGGGIAGGVVAFVLVILIMIIALISVWLFKRRRNHKKRNGSHYISIVDGIGNESIIKRNVLHSRPGYLQIIAPCAGYEIPIMSLKSETALPSNETRSEIKYPRRELRGCTDSNSSITSVQVTTEPIQTRLTLVSSTTTDLPVSSTQVNGVTKKLVKPYAVVDVKDIKTCGHLGTSRGVLSRYKLKTKHQKHEELPSNREALNKSFAFCPDNSTIQVEQPPSAGRYYTVPIYVNLNIPMTVNSSYKHIV